MNLRNLRRLLLSVFVCFCVLFSNLHIVNASNDDVNTLDITDEDIANGEMTILFSSRLNEGDWKTMVPMSTFTNHFTSIGEYKHNTKYFNASIPYRYDIGIMFGNKERIVKKGDTFDITLSNIVDYITVDDVGTYYYDCQPYNFGIQVVGASGEEKHLSPNYKITSHGLKYTIDVSDIVAPFDIYGIYVKVYGDLGNYDGLENYFGKDYTCTLVQGFNSTVFSVSIQDDTKGLLSSIIEWLQSIRDNIVNLPQKIANSIKGFFDNIVNKLNDVKNSITDALVSLGNFIINGIKGLFVPDEDTMLEVKEKWDGLLSSRFGALYEVIQLIDDYADTFKASKKGTIMFPTVCIPLGECDYEFGGWEVQIVPEGFDVIFDALKLITSICATVLFINGLRNRFERIIGRE